MVEGRPLNRFVTKSAVVFWTAGLIMVLLSCTTPGEPVATVTTPAAPSTPTEPMEEKGKTTELVAVPLVSSPMDPPVMETIESGSFAEPELPIIAPEPAAGAAIGLGLLPTDTGIDTITADEVEVPVMEQASASVPGGVPAGPGPIIEKKEALSPKKVAPSLKNEALSPEKPSKASVPASIPAEEDGLSRVPIPIPASTLPELPARIAPTTTEETVLFSRKVRATVGQLVEVPFNGTGWVFLGELGSRKGLPYDSRRLDAEGQSFVFRAEAAGIFALKFYKQDFVQDYILNDYVQVTIAELPGLTSIGGFNAPRDRGRVVAEPRWPSSDRESVDRNSATVHSEPVATPMSAVSAGESAAVGDIVVESSVTPVIPPPAANSSENVNTGSSVPQAAPETTGSSSSVPPGAPSFPETALPEEYLDRARREYEAGTVGVALQVLDLFRERFPAGSDEAWWLYGRALEAAGPNRDIKSSLGFYKRLVSEYSQSSRYAEARKRIAYLERYYFDIR